MKCFKKRSERSSIKKGKAENTLKMMKIKTLKKGMMKDNKIRIIV
jgi:hypothetical protein